MLVVNIICFKIMDKELVDKQKEIEKLTKEKEGKR